jgi:ATP-binding cassette, subfamily B, bacterial MsbA
MQGSELFAGTISENLSYADDFVDEEALNGSLLAANALEFVSKYPAGVETYLSENGGGLSGGQKQRLSIARALYRDPKILILDEATSSLDSESEAVLVKNMNHLLKDKTAIIIAHRLSTVIKADRIIVIKNGKIVEDGNHKSLMDKKGVYSRLFYSQFSA